MKHGPLTNPLPDGFVIPNGGWGRGDDWTRPPGDTPGHEPRDLPAPPLYWKEPAD